MNMYPLPQIQTAIGALYKKIQRYATIAYIFFLKHMYINQKAKKLKKKMPRIQKKTNK